MKILKTILCASLFISTAIYSKAQQKSLTIDNQTPGWLSSKIAYGDQKTVENLTVTGYLNTSDLEFISSLAKNQSLHGRLDLELANIVGDTPNEDNYLKSSSKVFAHNTSSDTIRLKYFCYPRTITRVDKDALSGIATDTLFLNCINFVRILGAKVKHLKIGSRINRIRNTESCSKLESIEFPSTLREIREVWQNTLSCSGLSWKVYKISQNVFPNLERLVSKIQVDSIPDSIYLPKIKFLSLDQYYDYNEKKMFKKGMHIFIGEEIDTLTDMSQALGIKLHFSNSKPPVIENGITYHGQPANRSDYILYVPKGSAEAYRNCFKFGGTEVTIIEESINVTSLSINKHKAVLAIDETLPLLVEIQPDKASDKTVKWSSSNPDVVEVSDEGIVKAKQAGSAMIRAFACSNPLIQDSCEVTVIKPITSIIVSETSLVMRQNKDKQQLSAVIIPEDATDKNIIWSSSNEEVAEVDKNGLVSAKKVGKATIKATSATNPTVFGQCQVTVIQPVSGIKLSETALIMSAIGETKQLFAEIQPSDASEKTVLWTSSNPSVCMVSNNGTIVAVGFGTATIIATTVDGGFIAVCVINVSQSTIITAKNYTRLYGENNPSFEYTANISSISGIPNITCEANKTSPVGIYPIVVSRGSVSDPNCTYVNGTLTITKAPLAVSTKNYTRAYGEDNPSFELQYIGFVNGENESVLVSTPIATTEATKESDTGVYDISIGNGVAENYELSYTNGKLTIEKAYQTLTWEQNLEDVQLYDQVELTAKASSGLDVSYSVFGDNICSVSSIGGKHYLDCYATGEAVVVAMQEGNLNYWQTTKIYKSISINNTTGLNTTNTNENHDTIIFDTMGNRHSKLKQGINIIKMSDGTTKKVLVK